MNFKNTHCEKIVNKCGIFGIYQKILTKPWISRVSNALIGRQVHSQPIEKKFLRVQALIEPAVFDIIFFPKYVVHCMYLFHAHILQILFRFSLVPWRGQKRVQIEPWSSTWAWSYVCIRIGVKNNWNIFKIPYFCEWRKM